MADQIQSNDGMMLGMGQRAWHGKGKVIDGLATAVEALRYANLDWNVGLEPVALANHRGPDDSLIIVPGYCMTVRDDDKTILGMVGENYKILQNRDVFSVFDAIAERGDAIYETAGSLFGGATVFVTARLTGLLHVGPGNKDVIEKYLLVSNTHDGSGAVNIKLVNCRVVCANTLAVALKEGGKGITIRHTSSMAERVAKATLALGIANKEFLKQEESFNAMYGHPMTDKQVRDYVEAVFTVSKPGKADKQPKTQDQDLVVAAVGSDDKKERRNIVDRVMEVYGTSNTVNRGDLWGAFNAITEWSCHHRTYSSQERSNNTKEDNKLNSILYGQTALLNTNAYALAGAVLLEAGKASVGPKEMIGAMVISDADNNTDSDSGSDNKELALAGSDSAPVAKKSKKR